MQTKNLPPVIKLAETIVYECEIAVKSFDRYYKYTLGTDIRQQAMAVWRVANKAWLYKEQQSHWIQQALYHIDDLKLSLQLGKRLKIFASVAQFERLAVMIVDLGRQCGGWYKASQKFARA